MCSSIAFYSRNFLARREWQRGRGKQIGQMIIGFDLKRSNRSECSDCSDYSHCCCGLSWTLIYDSTQLWCDLNSFSNCPRWGMSTSMSIHCGCSRLWYVLIKLVRFTSLLPWRLNLPRSFNYQREWDWNSDRDSDWDWDWERRAKFESQLESLTVDLVAPTFACDLTIQRGWRWGWRWVRFKRYSKRKSSLQKLQSKETRLWEPLYLFCTNYSITLLCRFSEELEYITSCVQLDCVCKGNN